MDKKPRLTWDDAAYSTADREEPLLLRGIMPQSEGVRDEEVFNMEPDDRITTQGPGNPEQESQQKTPETEFYRIRVVTPKPLSFAGKAAKALEGMKKVFRKISKRFKRKKPTEEPQRGRSDVRYTTRGQPLPPFGRTGEDIRK